MYQSKNWFSTDGAIKTVEIAPVNPAYVINAEKIMQCIVGKIVLLLVFGLLPLASAYAQNNNLAGTMWQYKEEGGAYKIRFDPATEWADLIGIGGISIIEMGEILPGNLISYDYNPPNITLLFDFMDEELQVKGVINGKELHTTEATFGGEKAEYLENKIFIKQESVYLHGTEWTGNSKAGAKQTISFNISKDVVNLDADGIGKQRFGYDPSDNIKVYNYEHPNITVYSRAGTILLEGTINKNELRFKDNVFVLQTKVASKFSEIQNNLAGTEWEYIAHNWIIHFSFKNSGHLEVKSNSQTNVYAYSYEKPYVTCYIPDELGEQQTYVFALKGSAMVGRLGSEIVQFKRVK